MSHSEEFFDTALVELKHKRRVRFIRNAVFFIVAMFALGAGWRFAKEGTVPSSINVLPVVKIGGEIGASIDIEDLTSRIERAFQLSQATTKTIVLSIDSPGGDPTLAQRINARLRYLRSKNPDVRVVAACERVCASAAYMIAIQADEVIAGPYSLVGSIGAIIGTFNFSGALEKFGVSYQAYGSGASKSMLNPFMPLREEDKDIALRLVNELGQLFETEVRERRKIDSSIVIDSGEVWTAYKAKEMGLIDRVAVIEDVAFGDLSGAVPVVIKPKKQNLFSSMVQSSIHSLTNLVSTALRKEFFQ